MRKPTILESLTEKMWQEPTNQEAIKKPKFRVLGWDGRLVGMAESYSEAQAIQRADIEARYPAILPAYRGFCSKGAGFGTAIFRFS